MFKELQVSPRPRGIIFPSKRKIFITDIRKWTRCVYQRVYDITEKSEARDYSRRAESARRQGQLTYPVSHACIDTFPSDRAEKSIGAETRKSSQLTRNLVPMSVSGIFVSRYLTAKNWRERRREAAAALMSKKHASRAREREKERLGDNDRRNATYRAWRFLASTKRIGRTTRWLILDGRLFRNDGRLAIRRHDNQPRAASYRSSNDRPISFAWRG